MNKIVLTVVLLAVITGCKKAAPPPKPPHTVSVTKPTVCDVPEYVDYIGHVVAKRNVEVMAQVSGILIAQYFEEGQEVKRGDLLLVIDPRPFEAALAKAEATLAQTYASLRYDKETTVRYAPLVQQDFISQLNYDQYVTNVLVDEAVVGQNKAEIENAKINLGYCYITAPMDCVTGKLQVKTGNFVDAEFGHSAHSSQSNPAHSRRFLHSRNRSVHDSAKTKTEKWQFATHRLSRSGSQVCL